MPDKFSNLSNYKSKPSSKTKSLGEVRINNKFDEKIYNLSLQKNQEKSPHTNKIKKFITFFAKFGEQIIKEKQIHCPGEKEIIEEKKEKISIIFRRDIDEQLLMFDLDISVKEMLNKYLEKYSSVRSLDNDKIFFIYRSKILNNPYFLNKTLKSVFGNRQNSIVNVIIPGAITVS